MAWRTKVWDQMSNTTKDIRDISPHGDEGLVERGSSIVVIATIQMYCNAAGLYVSRRLHSDVLWIGRTVNGGIPLHRRSHACAPGTLPKEFMPCSLGGLGMGDAAQPVPWRNPQRMLGCGACDASRTARRRLK